MKVYKIYTSTPALKEWCGATERDTEGNEGITLLKVLSEEKCRKLLEERVFVDRK